MMLTVMFFLPLRHFLWGSQRTRLCKHICVCHSPAMQMEKSSAQEGCVTPEDAEGMGAEAMKEDTIMC